MAKKPGRSFKRCLVKGCMKKALVTEAYFKSAGLCEVHHQERSEVQEFHPIVAQVQARIGKLQRILHDMVRLAEDMWDQEHDIPKGLIQFKLEDSKADDVANK